MNLDFSFYNWDLISNFVLKGLYFSLMLTLVATIGGVLFGTVLALMRLSGRKWLDVPATIYVNGMRSIPLVMVILWFFLLMPAIIGRPIGAELSAVVTFIAFEAAYFSEIMRAGIQSIPRGQVYAGQALGMTYSQNMKLVVLPQAFRNMLPVLLTQTIILFQDTSLVYAIGAYDLLKGFETAGKNFGRPIESYLLAAVIYFIICYVLSYLVKRLHGAKRILGRSARHYQHIFAARIVGLIPLCGLAERGFCYLLVQLCQLAAKGNAALRPKGLYQIGQRSAQLMRRFVEHHGAHFVFDGLQVVLTALFIDAQKALKRKSARRQSRYRQRGNDGARARHNKHRHVVLGA